MENKRKFLRVLLAGFSAIAVLLAAFPLFRSLQVRPERKRDYDLEVDLSDLKPGASKSLEWLGQTVVIYHRTQNDLLSIRQMDPHLLQDPDSLYSNNGIRIDNFYRSLRKYYFVYIPQCTHLGCAVRLRAERGGMMGEDWLGGFHCPCHGSNYDLAGRVYKNQVAPANLSIPHYWYKKDKLVLGIKP